MNFNSIQKSNVSFNLKLGPVYNCQEAPQQIRPSFILQFKTLLLKSQKK